MPAADRKGNIQASQRFDSLQNRMSIQKGEATANTAMLHYLLNVMLPKMPPKPYTATKKPL